MSMTAEMTLLALCAVRPVAGDPTDRMRQVSGRVDWDRFLRTVHRHRMAFLASEGLRGANVTVPADVDSRLRSAARDDVGAALTMLGHAFEIRDLLAGKSVQVNVLKGPPLSLAAYGDLHSRQCRDLDIMVDAADVAVSHAALLSAGYTQTEPKYPLDGAGLRRWLRFRKDITYRHARSGMLIELHSRPVSNRYMLPPAVFERGFVAADDPVLKGLRILTGDDLLLYLCVHGASHMFVRLKWLADIAALVGRMPPDRLDRLFESASAKGLARPVGLALIMSHDIFRTVLPPAVSDRLTRDRRLRMLVGISRKLIHEPREQLSMRFATTINSFGQLLIRDDWRYLRTELIQPLADWRAADAMGGSRRAVALSVVLRPFLWTWRKAKRRDVMAK